MKKLSRSIIKKFWFWGVLMVLHGQLLIASDNGGRVRLSQYVPAPFGDYETARSDGAVTVYGVMTGLATTHQIQSLSDVNPLHIYKELRILNDVVAPYSSTAAVSAAHYTSILAKQVNVGDVTRSEGRIIGTTGTSGIYYGSAHDNGFEIVENASTPTQTAVYIKRPGYADFSLQPGLDTQSGYNPSWGSIWYGSGSGSVFAQGKLYTSNLVFQDVTNKAMGLVYAIYVNSSGVYTDYISFPGISGGVADFGYFSGDALRLRVYNESAVLVGGKTQGGLVVENGTALNMSVNGANGNVYARGNVTAGKKIFQGGNELLPKGAIMPFFPTTSDGVSVAVPKGWALCDGGFHTAPDGTSVQTPDLIDNLMVMGATSVIPVSGVSKYGDRSHFHTLSSGVSYLLYADHTHYAGNYGSSVRSSTGRAEGVQWGAGGSVFSGNLGEGHTHTIPANATVHIADQVLSGSVHSFTSTSDEVAMCSENDQFPPAVKVYYIMKIT